MRPLLALVAAALLLAAPASAAAPRFVVVSNQSALPSADTPNASGSLVLPPAWDSQPSTRFALSFSELQGLWQQAGQAYGIPWEVLGAINKIETNFGQNMGPSSAGAVGWMQFMPGTWLRWGVDASGDGVADPWNPYDAVHAAARYLAAAGGRTDLQRGVFSYNHAQWYVDDVLELAQVYARGGLDVGFGLGDMELRSATADVGAALARLEAAQQEEQRLARVENRLLARVARAKLLSDRLTLQKRAVQAGLRREAAAARAESIRAEIAELQGAVDSIRNGTWSPPMAMTVISPSSGGEVFPVGGGAGLVSVGRDHHDYPAADIAAPYGSPIFAHVSGLVTATWLTPNGRCGIGMQIQAGDGRTWTYCHFAYLEPTVRAGEAIAAGTRVGAVGTTGHTTGPHLHLQLSPATSYPQNEAWFQRFAGSAFHWQGEPAPVSRTLAAAAPHPVFAVVPATGHGDPIEFTR